MGSILSMQWPSQARRQDASRSGTTWNVIAGSWHELVGRMTVLRGTLERNDILRARGYRTQLVGMLQRLWGRDRASVEKWVDTRLRTPASRSLRPLGDRPAQSTHA
jgi:uncharacterized protein YjbJ (UPF0337 family)